MKRLELLDYSRLAAAVCVLAFHYLFNGINNGKISSVTYIPVVVEFAKYGYLGVEFFFMISGYVIYFSARNKTAKDFAVSRAVRLYPAFWIAVAFTTVFAQSWGGPQMSVTLSQALANVTMVPALFGYGYVDGVYWTLQLELHFYFMVLFFLLAGWQKRFYSIFLLWPVVMLIALFAGRQDLPYMGEYYCYFAAGALFAVHKDQPSKWSVISIVICAYLCVEFSAGKATIFSMNKGFTFSAFVIGAIICAQFIFFVLLNSRYGSNLRIPGSRLACDLTYPLFLVHAHFGYMFISRFSTNKHRLIFYALTVSIVFLVAFLIHIFVERKCARLWYLLFLRTLGSFIDAFTGRMHRLAHLLKR